MSDLNDLEQHIFAYFVADHAADFAIANRFYPYGDLVLIWDDKFKVATRKFGLKVKMKTQTAANALLDLLIEKGGYSTKHNDHGGSMHSFQLDEYRQIIKDEKASNAIIQKAQAEGPDFWKTAFAELTGQPA